MIGQELKAKPVDEYFQLLQRLHGAIVGAYRQAAIESVRVRLPHEEERQAQQLATRSLVAVRRGWT
jgi:hypothetical protein